MDATEGGRYVSVSVRACSSPRSSFGGVTACQLWGRYHWCRQGRYLKGGATPCPLRQAGRWHCGYPKDLRTLLFSPLRDGEREARQLAKAFRPLMAAPFRARRALRDGMGLGFHVSSQATDASILVRQAGVTDDVPLHVLAGNVVPLAKGHHMTTVDVQNSSLVLVVAVPKDNVVAPAVRLCTTPCVPKPAACCTICNAVSCLPGRQQWQASCARACTCSRRGAGRAFESAGRPAVPTWQNLRGGCAEADKERVAEDPSSLNPAFQVKVSRFALCARKHSARALHKPVLLPQARCGGACGGAPQSGVLNACGGLYWDSGEDLNVGRALDNYVSFTAQLTWQAQVRGGPRGASCSVRPVCDGGPLGSIGSPGWLARA